ncbi:uncharacterized protein LOC129872429 [Solanum dulcamara]|uniref:uncharacterized protein LOC129872429 n=1 Tax=Solanum dulcamara TaxID=45834 RepID=UPI0024864A51|nr:uncharacterized protein LOC129872429 [Solanum dulcamara]
MMLIKVVVEWTTLNIISTYTPQSDLAEEEKRRFWEDLDELVGSISPIEKLFVGGDFNGYIRSISEGYDDVHGGFSFGYINREGISLLEFARAFELVIANSSFPKKKDHLVTFRSSVAETRINFLLLRKDDKGDRDFVLGYLEHTWRYQYFGYFESSKVKAVKGVVRRMR